ncbi:MAG TPA: hypothetical protein DIU15_06880 [Deltaproteobacteria bacterium]|nr:hypothetical protein [Deltaproteobacteria bacterium]HCP45747.1 hypothetical protein [Deltaproteobacteria bacterium]
MKPSLLPSIGLVLSVLSACGGDLPPIETTDRVELVLHTTLCEPEAEPPVHFHADDWNGLSLAWDILCVRDGGTIQWWGLKVSHWEDRAEDLWDVWYIDPALREVRYGEAQIDGGVDLNNTSFPHAMERVPPRALVPGDYRVEVWGILENYLDSQWAEARITIVP